jgi:hypothetical protein
MTMEGTSIELMSTIWQVGGGLAGSPYDELFVKYGLALIGPGDAGRWTPERNDGDFDGSYVRRFATEPQIGDVILLRVGSDKVVAVGKIASEYQYLEQFDDVNGWDLQHARRVRWRVLSSPEVFPTRVFGANPPRFSAVSSDAMMQFANDVMATGIEGWQYATLPLLPPPQPQWEQPSRVSRQVGGAGAGLGANDLAGEKLLRHSKRRRDARSLCRSVLSRAGVAAGTSCVEVELHRLGRIS